jgi:hypothetical protein
MVRVIIASLKRHMYPLIAKHKNIVVALYPTLKPKTRFPTLILTNAWSQANNR